MLSENTSKDHLFSIEISRNVERQKTLVFDLDFEKNVAVPTPDRRLPAHPRQRRRPVCVDEQLADHQQGVPREALEPSAHLPAQQEGWQDGEARDGEDGTTGDLSNGLR